MPVKVHVDEMHSDVATAAVQPSQQSDTRKPPPWETEDRWQDDLERTAWLARRVCAEDFDD
jgi:hypothetical protein